jgi:hypothetical protein
MKKAMGCMIGLFLLGTACFGQKALLVGPTQVGAGATVQYSVQLQGTTGNVAALQDTLTTTPTTPMSISTAAGTLPNKTVFCKAATCLVMGIVPVPTLDASGNAVFAPGTTVNNATITDGSTVQTFTLTVPTTAATGSTIALSLTNPLGADASGNAVTLNGSTLTVTVVSPLTLVQTAFFNWTQNQTAANFLALAQATATCTATPGGCH